MLDTGLLSGVIFLSPVSPPKRRIKCYYYLEMDTDVPIWSLCERSLREGWTWAMQRSWQQTLFLAISSWKNFSFHVRLV